MARRALAVEKGNAVNHVPSKSNTPPRWAQALLRGILQPRDREPIAGDLLEEFVETALPQRGPFRARLWYLRQVASLADYGNARVLFQVSSFWFLLFALVVAVSIKSETFSPFPAVAAFHGVMLAAGFHAASRTRRIRWGVAAGVTTSLAAVVLIMATLSVLGFPHPPFRTLPLLPCAATMLAAIGAAFGKRFGYLFERSSTPLETQDLFRDAL
jgi:hypothetical protein